MRIAQPLVVSIIKKALADFGASINVMPYKMFKQLGLREPKPTRMNIQLVEKSISYLRMELILEQMGCLNEEQLGYTMSLRPTQR